MSEFILIVLFLLFIYSLLLSIYVFIFIKKMHKSTVGKLRIIEEEGEEQPHIFLELDDTSVFNKNISIVTMNVTHEKPSL